MVRPFRRGWWSPVALHVSGTVMPDVATPELLSGRVRQLLAG